MKNETKILENKRVMLYFRVMSRNGNYMRYFNRKHNICYTGGGKQKELNHL